MSPIEALAYSFSFGLLHGILPDEHTWPITFSYAIGGASGKDGMKAGLFFSAAFTLQRMLLAELAYLALAPYLLSARVNSIVYLTVGAVMTAAGSIVLRQNRYPHLHLHLHSHLGMGRVHPQEASPLAAPAPAPPPPRWAFIHGFIAGFGFGGFSLFVNTVAVPAMRSAWLAFLPGLVFGIGTMATVVAVSGLVGATLRHTLALTAEDIKWAGTRTGGRALFFGGILFGLAGIGMFFGIERSISFDVGYLLIGTFLTVIVIPALVYSLREIRAIGRGSRRA
jgi:hypothetical protein